MARDNRSRITEMQNALAGLEGRVATLQNLADKADGRFQDIQTRRNEATRLRGEIETTKQQAGTLLTEITQSKTNASEAEEAIEGLVSDAETSKETFNTHSKNLEEIEGKLKKFEEEITEQLARATSGALALSFEVRKERVEEELKRWRDNLYMSVKILIGIGLFFFVYSFFATVDLQYFLKLTVSFPVIFAVWFSSIQYNKERFIVERYAFKAAQAKSLSAFSKTVKEINPSDEGQLETQKFVIAAIKKIYVAPKLGIDDPDFPLDKALNIAKEIIKARVK